MPLLTGSTERETDRNGLLSYAAEWHALFIGLSLGFAIAAPGGYQVASQFVFAVLGARKAQRSWNKKALREAKREPWYALGGLIVGIPLGLFLGGGL